VVPSFCRPFYWVGDMHVELGCGLCCFFPSQRERVEKLFKICTMSRLWFMDHKSMIKAIYTGKEYVKRADFSVVIAMILKSSSFYDEKACQLYILYGKKGMPESLEERDERNIVIGCQNGHWRIGLVGSLFANRGFISGAHDLYSGANKVLKLLSNNEKSGSRPKTKRNNGCGCVIGTSKYKIIVIVVVVGYGYAWWKTTKRHVTSRIDRVNCRLDEFAEINESTQEEVSSIRGVAQEAVQQLEIVRHAVLSMETSLEGIDGRQNVTNMGVVRLLRDSIALENQTSLGRFQANPNTSSRLGLPSPQMTMTLPQVHSEDQESSSTVFPGVNSTDETSSDYRGFGQPFSTIVIMPFRNGRWAQKIVLELAESTDGFGGVYRGSLKDLSIRRNIKGVEDFQTKDQEDYMAPECVVTVEGTRESDLFTFGVVALAIACGRKSNE
ncbi:mediator of RNA polymerase II transcription subunit 1 like protein, partial [Tanacetum coccineum]